MAKHTTYSCDTCKKAVAPVECPEEYKDCNAAEVTVEVGVSGFVGEGHHIGVFTETISLFLCLSCVSNLIKKIGAKKVLADMKGGE